MEGHSSDVRQLHRGKEPCRDGERQCSQMGLAPQETLLNAAKQANKEWIWSGLWCPFGREWQLCLCYLGFFLLSECSSPPQLCLLWSFYTYGDSPDPGGNSGLPAPPAGLSGVLMQTLPFSNSTACYKHRGKTFPGWAHNVWELSDIWPQRLE